MVWSAVPPLLPLAAVAIAVLVASQDGGTGTAARRDAEAAPAVARREGARARDRGRGAIVTGAVWALAAVAPVAAVASIWSAYYYLYALCGVALVVGALAARGPRWVAVAAVAVLACGSQAGRAAPEFATGRGAWTWQSHINRLYFDRATERVARYLDELKQAHPTVPPRSSFFFAGVPAYVAWQTADGPLVRWAYHDTTLHSYYQTEFSLKRARRGAVYFFNIANDTLHEEAAGPGQLRGLALRVMLNERLDTARDLLAYLDERGGSAPDAAYFRAWMEWGTGDTATAKELLVRAGVIPERGPAPEVARAVALDSAGNEPAAFAMLMEGLRRHSLDPRVHAALADLRLHQAPDDPQARLEAVAARVLAPQDGLAWLRWGAIQADDGRHSQAVRSLERALALGIGSPEREKQIRDAIDELRTMLPGGSLAQQELHRVADEKKARAGGGRQP